MRFIPIGADHAALKRYQSLFESCFSGLPKFLPDSLKWLYEANPDGQAVGFDAFEGDELAAHYVCVPATIRVNGSVERTLLSLNTATHPRYQGKGLFTKLAEMTYSAGSEQGFGSVYGVANANSTPGFVRKLGFQLVEPLRAMVGIGRLKIDFDAISANAQFVRAWAPDTLAWRCANPANGVRHCVGSGIAGFQARTMSNYLPAYAELPAELGTGIPVQASMSPLRLYLGLIPDGACLYKRYFDIPDRLRPSPLNLIFRDLMSGGRCLEKGRVSFSFLDFDAY